jgi:hypothetical protein
MHPALGVENEHNISADDLKERRQPREYADTAKPQLPADSDKSAASKVVDANVHRFGGYLEMPGKGLRAHVPRQCTNLTLWHQQCRPECIRIPLAGISAPTR